MKRFYLFAILSILLVFPVRAQEFVKFQNQKAGWEAIINKTDGTLNSLTFKDGTILNFRTDSLRGPRWTNAQITNADFKSFIFSGKNGSINYSLRYKSVQGNFAIVVGLTNNGSEVYSPKFERINMGVNTEMQKFPEWNDVFFPSLLRCEKKHFWGYLMTPKGRIITVGSSEPIASYVRN